MKKVYIIREKQEYKFDPDWIDDTPPLLFVEECELKKYEDDYNIIDVIEVETTQD
ncbi:hypothetical protein [Paenibacillus sp. 7541]|uniref:hypothetical protein n=1 Tax=Paenibacillus sp. 7541 TaxID=2026236 RepID=UPI00159580E8|nr:hypothetical protein [Paenibacillus sp. 7541]